MADNGDIQRSHLHRRQPRRKSSSRSPRHYTTPSSHIIDHAQSQDYLTVPESVNPTVVHADFLNENMDYTWDMVSGGRLAASTSEKGSYHDSATDCAITDDTNSSWLVVQQQHHHRKYSNETSGDASDGGSLSLPGDGQAEWPFGAAFAVNTDTTFIPAEENNHQLFLPDLSSPRTQPLYNTYQHSPGGGEDLGYHETLENYSLHHTVQPGTAGLPFRSFKRNDGAEPSWNHLEHRVPRYDPGYASFGPPSPSESVHHETPISSPEGSKPRSSGKKKTRTTKPVKSDKGNSKATLTWEHTVVEKGGLTQLFEHTQEEPKQKRFGCRKGELPPATKEKVRRVRKLGACWPCWVLKVPCSEGDICERCKKQAVKCSPIAEQLCSRAGFIDYEETFFPEFLHSHFDRKEIKKLINNHTIRFTDTAMTVEVTTGQCFEPMRIFAYVFQPKDAELLRLHRVTAQTEEPSSQLVSQYSAPIGIMAFSLSDMKPTCKDHLEKMIRNPEYALQTTAGDPTEVPYFILEAILKYYFATNNSLLHNALMLHACHYFMAHLLTFSDETAEILHRTVDPYGAPRGQYFSSRLLSRQVKYAMHVLHRELLRNVLEGLEKSMRARTKDSWGPSFCTILLLCVCIEGLQVAADNFIVCDLKKSEADGVASHYSREQSLAACQKLDAYPFQQATRLFHDIYRSHRETNGGGKEGFNPVRSLRLGVTTGLDEPTEAMLQHISFAFSNSYTEILELSENPPFLNAGFHVAPRDIKVNNTGRLASKFLMSFFPTPA